jgi:hypothetical protein
MSSISVNFVLRKEKNTPTPTGKPDNDNYRDANAPCGHGHASWNSFVAFAFG